MSIFGEMDLATYFVKVIMPRVDLMTTIQKMAAAMAGVTPLGRFDPAI